jgi:uncharacterized protein (DUF736 family)
MITIGTFTKTTDATFHGAIRTLTLKLDAVEIRPIARAGDKAPDHRVSVDGLQIGAGWTVARQGKPECLSLQLDDPGFPAPVHALLVLADGDRFDLRWTRAARR